MAIGRVAKRRYREQLPAAIRGPFRMVSLWPFVGHFGAHCPLPIVVPTNAGPLERPHEFRP